MTLPLFDPIAIPPGHTLVDINSLEPAELREQHQANALELWMAELGIEWDEVPDREWDDNEGIFAVVEDSTGDIVGVAIILDVEDA